VSRDASIATGTAAVGMNPDYVTDVKWWEDRRFSGKDAREAAELIAFDVFKPVLRSRKTDTKAARNLYDNRRFRKEIKALLKKDPSRYLHLPLREEVSRRLSALEERLDRIKTEERRR